MRSNGYVLRILIVSVHIVPRIRYAFVRYLCPVVCLLCISHDLLYV
jgi:hypothetical protein